MSWRDSADSLFLFFPSSFVGRAPGIKVYKQSMWSVDGSFLTRGVSGSRDMEHGTRKYGERGIRRSYVRQEEVTAGWKMGGGIADLGIEPRLKFSEQVHGDIQSG